LRPSVSAFQSAAFRRSELCMEAELAWHAEFDQMLGRTMPLSAPARDEAVDLVLDEPEASPPDRLSRIPRRVSHKRLARRRNGSFTQIEIIIPNGPEVTAATPASDPGGRPGPGRGPAGFGG